MKDHFADMKQFADIPGTLVYTGALARKGFHLNQFCMSLMRAENRQRFRDNEPLYLSEWAITESQSRAVLCRDYATMMAEGGNIYFLAKIGATDGLPFVAVAASMSGQSEEEYRAMMIAGGRSPTGNRSIRENC